MEFRDFVKIVRLSAQSQGIRLSMSKLNDAIAIACINRPYSPAVAADRAGNLAPFQLPPQFLEDAAYEFGLDPVLFANAFPEIFCEDVLESF